MLIAGAVAGVLCASVGYLVVTQGLRSTLSVRQDREHSEHALVTDCLANVDRVIEAPARPPDLVVDLRPFDSPELDDLIDLTEVVPRHAPPPPLLPRLEREEELIEEPPSIWRVPSSTPPRRVSASA
jgi:hypothetical protein